MALVLKDNGDQSWMDNVDTAKRALLTDQLTHDYRELIANTVFKGASVRFDREGQPIDWKLPFSDTLSEACFDDRELRGKLESGTLDALAGDDGLTDFGKVLRNALKEKMLIDLGCGAEQSTVPKKLAHAFGSNAYVGVDTYEGFVERTEKGNPPCVYIQGDILDTVTRLAEKGQNPGNMVLLLSGIELSEERFPGFDASVNSGKYAEAFRHQLNKLKPAAVIIGACTSEMLKPDKNVFSLVGSSEVYSHIGTGGHRINQIWVPKQA